MSDAQALVLAFAEAGPPWPTRRQAPEIKRRIPRQARAPRQQQQFWRPPLRFPRPAAWPASRPTPWPSAPASASVRSINTSTTRTRPCWRSRSSRVGLGLAEIARALSGEIDPTPEGRVRAMVRAAVHAFRGRQRARKAVMEAVLSQGHHAELMQPVRRLHRRARRARRNDTAAGLRQARRRCRCSGCRAA